MSSGTISSVMTPIHREGWPFITLFALITFVLGLFWTPFWVIGGLLTAWCIYFFRDPARVTPDRDGLVISPADGVVESIGSYPPPPELGLGDAPRTRIAVFMNVFDVHVNRVPCDGTIVKLDYRPGLFLNAAMDKASTDNERQTVLMQTKDGQEIIFVQIAGLVARRILCDLTPGQDVTAGERFGLIRFGSRVDVYLPDNAVPLVVEGQRAVAGETVLAERNSSERPRRGRKS